MRALILIPGLLLGTAETARAEDNKVDLSKYDCTRSDDAKTVSGDKLAEQGFQIVTRDRFSDVSLMMNDPKSKTLANCFKRQEGAK